MIILAADTSGKLGSVALARCNPGTPSKVIEVVPLVGGTFSAQLVPQIAALLSAHGLSKEEIGAFAVASGPGSFTGLRVGLAAIKALAEILHKPIAAISLLEAVARSGQTQGKVLAVLDAGRGEVYAGEYDVHSVGATMFQERLLTCEELLHSAVDLTVITPDQAFADLILRAGRKVERVTHPRSDIIARLGWEKVQTGDTVAAEDLEANYLRRSDAEIFSKAGN